MLLDKFEAPDWHGDTPCVNRWELFDSPSGDKQINACKTICFTMCEVRSQCLHDAMKTEVEGELRSTFRGGYAPMERSTIMGNRTRKDWTYSDTLQF